MPALMELVKDKDANVRQAAASVLGSIGIEAKAAVPTLTDLLHDNDVQVRQAAAFALASVWPKAKIAIEALTELVKGKDTKWEGRHKAAMALSEMGPAAVPALTELLANENAEARSSAHWPWGRFVHTQKQPFQPSRNCSGTRTSMFNVPPLRLSEESAQPPFQLSRTCSRIGIGKLGRQPFGLWKT